MSFIHHATGTAALALFLLARISSADAAAGDYRFELAGNPESVGGKSIVAVRLTHTPDNKPVPGAIIIQTRADMGPNGMQDDGAGEGAATEGARHLSLRNRARHGRRLDVDAGRQGARG